MHIILIFYIIFPSYERESVLLHEKTGMKKYKILILTLVPMLLILSGCGKSASVPEETFQSEPEIEAEVETEQNIVLSEEEAIELLSVYIFDLDVLEDDNYKCKMSQIEINEITENSLIATGIFGNEYFITNRPVKITCKLEENEIVEWEDEDHLQSLGDSNVCPVVPVVPFEMSMIEEMNLTVRLENAWSKSIYELNSDEIQVEYLTEHKTAFWGSDEVVFPIRIIDSEGNSYIVTEAIFMYQPAMVTCEEWDGSPSWYVLRGANTAYDDVDLSAFSELLHNDFYK